MILSRKCVNLDDDAPANNDWYLHEIDQIPPFCAGGDKDEQENRQTLTLTLEQLHLHGKEKRRSKKRQKTNRKRCRKANCGGPFVLIHEKHKRKTGKTSMEKANLTTTALLFSLWKIVVGRNRTRSLRAQTVSMTIRKTQQRERGGRTEGEEAEEMEQRKGVLI